jgi:hypothetical protein
MNCKQGDLAVVVRSASGNEGRIVRCIRTMGVVEWKGPGNVIKGRGVAWLIDPPLPAWHGRLDRLALDACLRPIRDQDGEDEMLRIVGKPHEVAA